MTIIPIRTVEESEKWVKRVTKGDVCESSYLTDILFHTDQLDVYEITEYDQDDRNATFVAGKGRHIFCSTCAIKIKECLDFLQQVGLIHYQIYFSKVVVKND